MNPDFVLTSLIVIATPGTGALYTIARGLGHGPRAAVVAAFGCTLGIVPHMAAAGLGLAAVMQSSPLLFSLMQALGIAYLVYLAVQIFRAPPLDIRGMEDRKPASTIITQAVLINLLNPKLSLFFLAFLPQFVGSDRADMLDAMLGLAAAFMAMTFVVFAAYGVIAAKGRDRLAARPATLLWLNRVFAAAFLAMAVKLALG